ncbi:MAG: riboflavin biosynthesis protein RibF [Deltaproteobacteria bacterium]|nr:MAG: riboflavin biosynthesis protein RibF [Deltaproteobacteria bacterium]
MRCIESLDKITGPFHKAVITIGNFDGVHIGHQALFHEVIEHADAIGGTSMAITFEPHPNRVVNQNSHPPLITLYEQKKELIESTGIDVLICVPFTREFANITARSFVEDFLVKQIGMKAIVVGRDYTFGRNREGNIDYLKQYAQPLGYQVIVAGWIQDAKTRTLRVSSTRIRKLVMTGKVREARQLLGRPYQIRGTVTTGRGRGAKLLDCPTANITLQDELAPDNGVYVVTVTWQKKKYIGVANIGYSPTFDDHLFTVEVHIIDFNKNIVGEKIQVDFIDRLRGEIKFSNLTALSDQIQKDIEIARNMKLL